jgi:hypothetical protein
LGDRPDGSALFGRMIREARIHFAAVIEEARIAGLDTGAIAVMLGKLKSSWPTASGPSCGCASNSSSPSEPSVNQRSAGTRAERMSAG